MRLCENYLLMNIYVINLKNKLSLISPLKRERLIINETIYDDILTESKH